ncbi:meiosis-specific with OB domain-containing protein-like [Diadema antillarum]|uniref:meiosis-specific with OB domain-containing protein-like n=1 Tax=Diadema antillarum TaxID=105358 RepID=UPI003A849CC7
MAWSGHIGGDFGSQSTWPDGTPIGQVPSTSSGRRAGDRVLGVEVGAGGGGERVHLKDLTAHSTNVTVVGLVIAKQHPRKVPSKTSPGTDRSVLSFTLRDSPVDFINATCWGSREHIQGLGDKFCIGDLVEITNPQVRTKSNSEIEERYHPWTPSAFQLTVSERYSKLNLYDGWPVESLGALQHTPIRDSADYYTLGDVLANGQNLHREHINLLALVKKVGIAKDIVTKEGRETKRCEVTLFDDTCTTFPLVIWDEEVISHAQQQWEARETVIFAVDVLVKYDDFRNTMMATVDSKTVFITNPDTREAHSLYKYGKTFLQDDENEDNNNKDNVDLQSIQAVYTVDELKTKASSTAASLGQPEYGICYAFLSAFDLDGAASGVLAMRCNSCRWRVDRETGTCLNSNCSAALTDQSQAVLTYDLRVSLSDWSGTIEGVYMGGTVAEQLIGCPVEEFGRRSEDQLTHTKWQHLLERCKVYFKLQPRPGIIHGSTAVVRILQCTKAEPDEALRNIKSV